MSNSLQNTTSPEEKMREIESRYAYENHFLEMVAIGNYEEASKTLDSLKHGGIEVRNKDTLRNLKNYCIIQNTLLRKTVEKEGVHPYYIDQYSSQCGKKIESISSLRLLYDFMHEMLRGYCALVQQYARPAYSLPIQQTILYIESNICADQSLPTLAARLYMNPSYLSALFHKETGMTLTEFVGKTRAKYAASLLNQTRLPIQTIAAECGIEDANYFVKIFKRYYGVTPSSYRKKMIEK